MSERADQDAHGPGPRPLGPTDNEIAMGWANMRRTAAVGLMFFGAVGLFSLALDQVLPTQRPTRPLVALTLGPILIAAGYLIDRDAFRYLLGRRPKSPAPSAGPNAPREPGDVSDPPTAGDLWALILGPTALGGLFLCMPLTANFLEGREWIVSWEMLGGIMFLGIWAIAMSKPFLMELDRRGAWVPPGMARYPYLVAVTLTALLSAAVVVVMLTLIWLERVSGLAR